MSQRFRQPLVLASLVAGLGLVALVAYDYQATRRELVELLRSQALALRETVSAAARSNRAAAAFSEAQLAERLLEQAREIAALDRAGRLTRASLDDVSRRSPLFRVGVFAANGAREDAAGEPGSAPGLGWGRGAGPGRGGGMGRGLRGGGQVLRQLLEEGKDEAVTDVHAPRWGGADRLAAGVRRAGGGAIVLTVDATEIARLERPASLDSLLSEITRGSPGIAYTVLEHEAGRLAFGDAPEAPLMADVRAGEREQIVSGRPVLEFVGEVAVPGGSPARLRLGMRLDDLRRVERRMGLRLAASVLVAAALAGLALSLAGLGRRYGVLSRKHALAEEALRRRDRLAAMGELASTVAHEVRNPLNAVGMTAQRLRREFLDATPADSSERAELGELLDVMSSETQRIDRIVQQFLDYARPPRLAPEPTELGPLVAELAERTRPFAASRGVALGTELSAAGRAHVDPAHRPSTTSCATPSTPRRPAGAST